MHIKRKVTATVIEKKVAESRKWVRSVALAFLFLFSSDERHNHEEELCEKFGMSVEKARAVILFFDFQSQRPDRRYLLEWIENSAGKVEDAFAINLIRAEKLHWMRKLQKENDKDAISQKANKVSFPNILASLNDSIQSMKQMRDIILAEEYDKKMVEGMLEHMNRLLINANGVIMLLQKKL